MAVLGRSRSGAPPPDQILDPPLCIYHCVITLGLHSKYDMDGHYVTFAVRIFVNP